MGIVPFLDGCADDCDVGVATIEERCDIEIMRDSDDECTPERQTFLRCADAHPREVCDYFFDPVVNGDNAFAMCIGL